MENVVRLNWGEIFFSWLNTESSVHNLGGWLSPSTSLLQVLFNLCDQHREGRVHKMAPILEPDKQIWRSEEKMYMKRYFTIILKSYFLRWAWRLVATCSCSLQGKKGSSVDPNFSGWGYFNNSQIMRLQKDVHDWSVLKRLVQKLSVFKWSVQSLSALKVSEQKWSVSKRSAKNYQFLKGA